MHGMFFMSFAFESYLQYVFGLHTKKPKKT